MSDSPITVTVNVGLQYSTVVETFTFNVQLKNPCEKTKVQANGVMDDIAVLIGTEGAIKRSFSLTNTESTNAGNPNYCGDYSCTMVEKTTGDQLPAYISFDPVSLTDTWEVSLPDSSLITND